MKTYSQIRSEARLSMVGKWGSAALAVLVLVALSVVTQLPYQISNVYKMSATDGTKMLLAMGITSLFFLIYFLSIFFIEAPLTMGLGASFVKIRRNNSDGFVRSMFSIGYSSVGRAIVFTILMALIVIGIMLLWYVAVIVMFIIAIAVCFTEGQLSEMFHGIDMLNDKQVLDVFAKICTQIFADDKLIFICMLLLTIAIAAWFLNISYKYSLVYFFMFDNPEWSTIDCMRESRRMMKGHKWQLFVLDLTFIGWLLLCILIIPILWVEPYIKMSHAVFYDELLGIGTVDTDSAKLNGFIPAV